MKYLRIRILVVCSIAALLVRVREPRPEPKSAEGLAAMLGRVAGGSVRLLDIAWEPSPGMLAELIKGRRVLFLASRDRGPRDVFRATVRLTTDGKPVAVSDVHNLTSTPMGDEQALVAFGERAAFAIHAYGRVGQVTLLDLRGQSDDDSGLSFSDAIMSAVTNVQQTGSVHGLRRVDVVLDAPEPHLALAFEPNGRLSMTAEGGRAIHLDARSNLLLGDTSHLPARVSSAPVLIKRPILWAVDTVRAELGSGPIAWLEERAFAVRDWVRRLQYGSVADSAPIETSMAPAPGTQGQVPDNIAMQARLLDASGLSADASQWPPNPIPSLWKTTEPGEGVWEAVLIPWLRPLPGTGADSGGAGMPRPVQPAIGGGAVPSPGLKRDEAVPPYFYKTMIRPDPVRPYAKVLIVAMDTRQLELDMEGGVEDPISLTGVHGAGRIPRDPKILTRVVGAFNGAFKTTHGEYGMMVAHRVLLPPKPQAATLVVTRDHRIGLGTWGSSTAIPNDIVSFRQNLDPVVEDGKVMPSGRTQWGFQLPGTSMFTVRSGVCSTAAGHIYYVWGEELSGLTLAKAMLQAGCTYGMHLDMNPHHTAFVFANVRSTTNRDYEAKLLTPAMEVSADRYLEWSPKDFFYIMVRDTRPNADLGWATDGHVQPAPAWLPSVWQAIAASGVPGGGPTVKLNAFDPSRVAWRLRANTDDANLESSGRHQGHGRHSEHPAPESLSSEDMHRVLAAIGLGAPARDIKTTWASTSSSAALKIEPNGRLSLTLDESRPGSIYDRSQGATRPETGPATQRAAVGGAPDAARKTASSTAGVTLPILVKEGVLTPGAMERHLPRRRGAMCVAPSGHVVVASSTAESDQPNAEALRQVGCALVVALDRGSHEPWMMDRAGSASPPLSHYPQSVLYAIGSPMPPGVFRFGGADSSPTPSQ